MPEGRITPAGLLLATTPDELNTLADAELAAARAEVDLLVASRGPRTVENTLVPFNALLIRVAETAMQSDLVFNAHPDGGLREAGDRSNRAAKSLRTELGLNRGLYDLFVALDVSMQDEETRYAIHKILRDFRLAGVDRDEATREKIKVLRDEIDAIGSDFDRIISEDVRSVTARPEDLAGMPEDYVAAKKPGPDGLVTISTAYPDSIPIFQYAENADLRKRLLHAFNNRGHPANLEVLGRLLERREALAKLLGYANWGDYVTVDKMIGSGKAAAEFIGKITAAAEERAREDDALLVARKRKDQPAATSLEPWDRGFYRERVRTEQFSFDSREARAYFPYARVKEGMFGILGELLGLRFRKVEDLAVWDPSVEAYDLLQSDRVLGRFFLDMHPRPGKFTHAAAFPLVLGVPGGSLPQASLICNFPDPAKGPALMTHNDVLTFFHEFGHLVHMILSGGRRWVQTSMNEIEWDFVEAPSQLLEEWARDPAMLQTFARHHETGEPIPADLLARQERADALGRGLDVRRQMFLAALSLAYHTRDPKGMDTTAVAKELYARYELVPWFEGTHFQCGFGHLNGYSAVYYTYMWSLVIAKDLFSPFQGGKSILDPSQAAKYRQAILEAGSRKPAAEMVREYLGREPRFDAYAAWLNQAVG